MKLPDFITGHVSKDAFAERMVKAFKDQGFASPRYDTQQFAIDLGAQDGGGVMFLGHFYADYCRAPRLSRGAMPREMVIARTKGLEAQTAKVASTDALLPVVRDRSYPWFAKAQIESNIKDVQYEVSYMKLGADHLALLVLDSPTQTQQATDQVLQSMNIGFEDAFIKAVQNLRDISPDKWQTIGPEAYLGAWNDSFDCSRILLPDLLYRLNLPANPVVLIPARGVLLVTSSNSLVGQLLVFTAAKDLLEKNSRWTSAHMLELRDGKWISYTPTAPEVKALQKDMLTRMRIGNYDQQKGYLESRVKAEGRDIFVASYLAYEKDGVAFSAATWAEGVEAWIPKAEYLVFSRLIEGDSHDTFVLEWDVAFGYMAPWMIEVAGVLPVRYHVTDFPDAEMLEVLRSHKTTIGP
jgi:hypothetical protein